MATLQLKSVLLHELPAAAWSVPAGNQSGADNPPDRPAAGWQVIGVPARIGAPRVILLQMDSRRINLALARKITNLIALDYGLGEFLED